MNWTNRIILLVAIVVVVALLARSDGLSCRASLGQTRPAPVYIDQVEIQFTDGTSWSTTKPAWRVISRGSNGENDIRVCQGAAPATQP